MSSFKEKSQVFVIGLLIGLLVAGGFFMFKLDDYFKELNFYKRFAETFSSEKKIEQAQHTDDKQAVVKKEKNSKKEKVHKAASNSNEIQIDSSVSTASTDTTLFVAGASDEIVVKKDEMVSSKTYEIFNLNPVANKSNSKDSLLQKVSGIKDDRITGKQMVNVEFWTSPLNYRGYKMSKYKVVLYGVNASDDIKLFKLDDLIYLKSNATVYQLDYTGDFSSYERITDESILSKLK